MKSRGLVHFLFFLFGLETKKKKERVWDGSWKLGNVSKARELKLSSDYKMKMTFMVHHGVPFFCPPLMGWVDGWNRERRSKDWGGEPKPPNTPLRSPAVRRIAGGLQGPTVRCPTAGFGWLSCLPQNSVQSG